MRKKKFLFLILHICFSFVALPSFYSCYFIDFYHRKVLGRQVLTSIWNSRLFVNKINSDSVFEIPKRRPTAGLRFMKFRVMFRGAFVTRSFYRFNENIIYIFIV